jgi:hypothetical protein
MARSTDSRSSEAAASMHATRGTVGRLVGFVRGPTGSAVPLLVKSVCLTGVIADKDTDSCRGVAGWLAQVELIIRGGRES